MILFIGLDGATFHLLNHFTQSENNQSPIMPNLRALIARGQSAVLNSTAHPLTPCAWTTLFTGKNPGSHGLFDFMRLSDNGDEVFFNLNSFNDIAVETIWQMMSRQNKKVVCLNFPMMAPAPAINGVIVPGFTSWKYLRAHSHPPHLFDELNTSITDLEPKLLAWDFERENQIGEAMDTAYLAEWIRYHLPREKQWFELAKYLGQKETPDLLAVMFDGVDKIQHQAWHYLDPMLIQQPMDDETKMLNELAVSYFRQLDHYLGELIVLAGDEAQIYIASDHGFTASQDIIRVNRFLFERGHLAYRETDDSPEMQRRGNSPMAFLDWQKTKAYCPTSSSNAIRIRVTENYEQYRQQLVDELRDWRDELGPVIREIKLREQVFCGPQQHLAPDLTLVLRDYGFASIRNLSPNIDRRPHPVGTHHPDGIFIAAGGGIDRGFKPIMQIADVAAHLLYALDLPIPTDFDGKLNEHCYSAHYLETHPVQYVSAELILQAPLQKTEEINAEDKAALMAQLAALGYLEDD